MKTCRTCRFVQIRRDGTVHCNHWMWLHDEKIINWHDQHGYRRFGCNDWKRRRTKRDERIHE